MASNEVATPKSFDERMLDMFRENMGSMLTETEMTGIIEKGMEKLFFASKTTKSPHYPYPETVEPPLAYKLAEKMFREAAEQVLMKWLKDNEVRMLELLEQQLCNENLQKVMLSMFAGMVMTPISDSYDRIKWNIVNFGSQNNLDTSTIG